MSLYQKHVTTMRDLERETIETVFSRAQQMQFRWPGPLLEGRVLASVFFEPSTRTRFSFETAFCRLGGKVISTENARSFTSSSKGETVEDMARVLASFVDVIVMRSDKEGMAAQAAAASSVPVINAGDGTGEHPTQALLDLFTIQQKLGRLDGLRIALVGDLLYGRTAHSFCRAFLRFSETTFFFISPPFLAMREDVKEELRTAGIQFEEMDSWGEVLEEVDVVYITRIQKERFENSFERKRCESMYQFGPKDIARMRPRSIVMHPLPRAGEIDPAIDSDPRAAYFDQVRNGVFVRAALLSLVLGV